MKASAIVAFEGDNNRMIETKISKIIAHHKLKIQYNVKKCNTYPVINLNVPSENYWSLM